MQFNLYNYKEKEEKIKDRAKRAIFLHAWIRGGGGGGGGGGGHWDATVWELKFLFCFCFGSSADFTVSGFNGLFQG